MTERPVYTSPTVTRSLLVLEMAGSLYAIRGGPTDRRRCGCRARWRSAAGRPRCMAAMGLAPSSRSRSGSSTSPSSTRRGHSPSHSAAARPSTSRFHSAPSPVPSLDQLGLALAAHTGITSLSELRERRYPLRIAIRGGRSDHCLHKILDHVLEAAGLSLAAIKAWGGEVHYDRYPPNVSGSSTVSGTPSSMKRSKCGRRRPSTLACVSWLSTSPFCSGWKRWAIGGRHAGIPLPGTGP